jgi:hypothetical protein
VPRLRTAFQSALGAALIIACNGDLVLPGSEAPDPDASAIRVVDGDGQIGRVGETLEAPLEVVVTDTAGEPVRGAAVVFELTSAGDGAEISPSSTTTDSAGRAEAHMTLGDKVGLQTGAAYVVIQGATGPTAPFSALAYRARHGGPDDDDDDD